MKGEVSELLNGLTEIGEFDDQGDGGYKIVHGKTIAIKEHELHELWMIWVGMIGAERVAKDNLIRYIFPKPNT